MKHFFRPLAAASLALALAGTAAAQSKAELVAKAVALQQPAIETMARGMVEQQALQILQQVGNVVRQRAPADKREVLFKEMQGDVRKFVEDTVPLLRSTAVRLAPSTIGAVLDEKMNEEELRELIRIMESPVNRKFLALAPEMQRSLVEKMAAESKSSVDARLQALNQALNKRIAPYGGAASAPR